MAVSLFKIRYLPLIASAVVAIAGVGWWRLVTNSGQSSPSSSAISLPEGDWVPESTFQCDSVL